MPSAEHYGAVKLKGFIEGNDEFATVVDEEPPKKNRYGVEIKRILLIPHPHLITMYPELQKPGALPVSTPYGYAVWKEYPTNWIMDENKSKTNAMLRVDCAFDGSETPHTKRYEKYTNEINYLREKLENAKMHIVSLQEDIRTVTKERRVMASEIAELYKNIKGDKSAVPGERQEEQEENK